MITCNLLGGLGNQLFQIFTVLSYSIDCKNMPAFPDIQYTEGMTTRTTYWNTLFIYLQKYIFPNIFSYFPIFREKSFTYNELPLIKESYNVILFGYFQSYKYFEKNKHKIFEMIGLEDRQNEIRTRSKYIFSYNSDNNIDFNNTISMHFRIGDYKMIQDKHPILTKKYYVNAIDYILKNIIKEQKHLTSNVRLTLLYFCELSDLLEVEKIVKEIKEDLEIVNNVKIVNNENIELTFIQINPIFKDWEQLLIMSCCRYNIIANSTFSWWGAYFNRHIDQIVCYPSKWFGPSLTHSTQDLFPECWNKISDI